MQVGTSMDAPGVLDPLSMGKAVACVLVVAQHTLASHFGTFWRWFQLSSVGPSMGVLFTVVLVVSLAVV